MREKLWVMIDRLRLRLMTDLEKSLIPLVDILQGLSLCSVTVCTAVGDSEDPGNSRIGLSGWKRTLKTALKNATKLH